VYRFRDGHGRVLYVGRATDLRSRTRSYFGDLGTRRHLRRMVPQIARVEAVVCASTHEAAWLERNLLVRSKPRWNRAVGGQEVPQWLVVDVSADRPAVRLAHQPDDRRLTFGPYLGGERSRTALRAILRAWPVHLTGARASGTERAMAEVRGVRGEDREHLLTQLVRLLEGDPDARHRLEQDLVAARDEAVTGLEYETAGRIQDELVAAQWLLASQRVTAPLPPDLAVHGWAEGILVSFAGTPTGLDRWEIRRATADRGLTLSRLTPPAWQEFASVNASLAAALRQVA
jgi:excinuclease ABC subunit C